MRIWIVRHGAAIDPYTAGSDQARWLTDEGRASVRAVGALLADEGARPTQIFVSPLVRAVQTAELIAGALGWRDGAIGVNPALSPERGTTAQALAPLDALNEDAQVFLVSHEPRVRILCGHLLGEPRGPGFMTAGVTAIDWDGARGRLAYRVDPMALRVVR